MACRGMDAESCPNDGTKMHNENFTKNDVRKVRNVRILKIITILSANFNSGRFNRPEMNIQRKKNRLASPAKRKRKKVIYHTNLTFSFTPTPLKIVH